MISEGISEKYNTVKNNVGLFDFSFEGKIKVNGEGRIDFIDGIVSNDIKNLKENFGIYAAFLDRFGRILSDCCIYRFRDFLLITLPFSQKNRIFEKLKDEAILAKCNVEDLTLKYALLSLQGPKSKFLLKDLFNEEVTLKDFQLTNKKISNETINNIKNNDNKKTDNEIIKNNKINNAEITIIKTKRSNMDCYDLFFKGDFHNEFFKIISDAGKKYNIKKISNETYDILRLEAGIPLFGVDFDEKTILSEVSEKAISYTKGCFVGQEVIARIKNIGKGLTAKKLMKLEINANEKFGKNTGIFKENKKIGYITSSAFSPEKKKVIALGFLDRGFYDDAKEVDVGEDKINALVYNLS